MITILFVILGLLVANLSLLVVLVVLYRRHFHWLSWLAHDFKALNAYLYCTLSEQGKDGDYSGYKRTKSGNDRKSEIKSSAV